MDDKGLTFDKEKAYDEKISPLMDQIVKICKEEGIPIFTSFLIKKEESPDDDLYCTTCLPGDEQPETFKQMYNLIFNNPYMVTMAITKSKSI